MASYQPPKFDFFELKHTAGSGIVEVIINRPSKLNAMPFAMFLELGTVFRHISDQVRTPSSVESSAPDFRVVILSAAGSAFTAGIDIMGTVMMPAEDPGRTQIYYQGMIDKLQAAFTDVAVCPIPIIAVIHGICFGAGIDLIAACDIRIAADDARFSVKEAAVGIAADLGTLQRLPRLIGNRSVLHEWIYTAREFDTAEAKRTGLVSPTACSNKAVAMEEALKVAKTIAGLSPTAIYGTKQALLHNHAGNDVAGLRMQAVHNGALLQSEDMKAAFLAARKKQSAVFSKL